MPGPTAPVELARKELPFPTYVDNIVLTGTAVTVTKPAGHKWLWITATALCYMRTGGTAAVPGAHVVDGTGSMPVQPSVTGMLLNMSSVATFSIVGTAVVGLAWYRDHSTL